MIRNKALLGIFFFLFTLFSIYGCSTSKDSDVVVNPKYKSARVVGYLSADNLDKLNKIQFCKLTHLNLAFANPDQDGNLTFPGDIDAVIKYVKLANPNIKISISIAGGVLTAEHANNWKLLIDKTENRPAFVQKIMTYVDAHQLDGVDVDLEWDVVTYGYSSFVLELGKVLTEHKKLLTAALPNNSRFENITQQALNAFDFLNIMSYDSTGPWTPDNPGQHSSYENSKIGIEFWNRLQNVSSDKLNLGVPFYGYNFTFKPVTSATFAQIISVGSQYAEQDEIDKIFYNGRPTIDKKVVFASEYAGGIMIWEIGQDSFDQYSLLDVIHKKYTALNIKTSGMCGN